MSIIVDTIKDGRYVGNTLRKVDIKKDTPSAWIPSAEERMTIANVLKDFRTCWTTMHYPRVEFNDLSIFQRYITDMAAWNTYQPNDGNPYSEDKLGGWRSNAVRPIIRNRTVAMAAHAVSRKIQPKIFAYNDQNEVHEDAANAIDILLTHFKDRANYDYNSVMRLIAALYSPHSIGYTEYSNTTTWVKDVKVNGKWTYKQVPDEDISGPKHFPIPCDQFFFPNFFEPNVQKQDCNFIRRIRSYDEVCAEYPVEEYPNMVYVQPGVHTMLDDANKGMYQVYDPHMRANEVEELIYWRKKGWARDVRLIMINGVLITDCDEANPRMDHKYPVDKLFYLPINERCFSGKSLVFSMQSDARILNTLYQMRIDMGMLDISPPTLTTGSDKVGSNIFVPGMSFSFADENVKINPLRVATPQAFASMDNLIEKVESSVSETSQDPTQAGQNQENTSTAYQISRIEQNAATVLGLFLTMVVKHAVDAGELMRGDILQYYTLADLTKISADKELSYKTFFASKNGKMAQVMFDGNMPDSITPKDAEAQSFDILNQEKKNNVTLIKVNPVLVREIRFLQVVDADVVQPRSKDLARQYFLELYDRAIQNPRLDPEKLGVQLLKTDPSLAKNAKDYVAEAAPAPTPEAPGQAGAQPSSFSMPSKQNRSVLPQEPSAIG